jgi:hypothetical protein
VLGDIGQPNVYGTLHARAPIARRWAIRCVWPTLGITTDQATVICSRLQTEPHDNNTLTENQ